MTEKFFETSNQQMKTVKTVTESETLAEILSLKNGRGFVDLVDIEKYVSITPKQITELLGLSSTKDGVVCKFVGTGYAGAVGINPGSFDTSTTMYLTPEEIASREVSYMGGMYYFASKNEDNYRLGYKDNYIKKYKGSLFIKMSK